MSVHQNHCCVSLEAHQEPNNLQMPEKKNRKNQKMAKQDLNLNPIHAQLSGVYSPINDHIQIYLIFNYSILSLVIQYDINKIVT